MFRKGTVLLRQFFGQLCDAHVRMSLGIAETLAHEETEIWSQRLLRQLRVFYLPQEQKITNVEKKMKSNNMLQ